MSGVIIVVVAVVVVRQKKKGMLLDFYPTVAKTWISKTRDGS